VAGQELRRDEQRVERRLARGPIGIISMAAVLRSGVDLTSTQRAVLDELRRDDAAALRALWRPQQALIGSRCGGTGRGLPIRASRTATRQSSTPAAVVAATTRMLPRLSRPSSSVMNAVFGTPAAGNEISSNGGNGVTMTTNSISNLTVDFDSNQISHNAADGVLKKVRERWTLDV
jgi:hypothetical protein